MTKERCPTCNEFVNQINNQCINKECPSYDLPAFIRDAKPFIFKKTPDVPVPHLNKNNEPWRKRRT